MASIWAAKFASQRERELSTRLKPREQQAGKNTRPPAHEEGRGREEGRKGGKGKGELGEGHHRGTIRKTAGSAKQ